MRTQSVALLVVLLALGHPAFAQGTGPIAAYSFNDDSATTATDVSGNGRHGIISGATWTAAGRFGGALAFDGVNDWVTIPDNPALHLTAGMTVERMTTLDLGYAPPLSPVWDPVLSAARRTAGAVRDAGM